MGVIDSIKRAVGLNVMPDKPLFMSGATMPDYDSMTLEEMEFLGRALGEERDKIQAWRVALMDKHGKKVRERNDAAVSAYALSLKQKST